MLWIKPNLLHDAVTSNKNNNNNNQPAIQVATAIYFHAGATMRAYLPVKITQP